MMFRDVPDEPITTVCTQCGKFGPPADNTDMALQLACGKHKWEFRFLPEDEAETDNYAELFCPRCKAEFNLDVGIA